jgi:hypothetical protein
VSTRGHILILVLTFISLAFIVRLVRRNKLPSRYALLWLTIGAIIAVLATFPDLLDRTSRWLGIEYAPSTFFLGAITLLLLIVVHFSWDLARLDARTRVLAQELAVLRADPPPDRTRPPVPEDEPVDS